MSIYRESVRCAYTYIYICTYTCMDVNFVHTYVQYREILYHEHIWNISGYHHIYKQSHVRWLLVDPTALCTCVIASVDLCSCFFVAPPTSLPPACLRRPTAGEEGQEPHETKCMTLYDKRKPLSMYLYLYIYIYIYICINLCTRTHMYIFTYTHASI